MLTDDFSSCQIIEGPLLLPFMRGVKTMNSLVKEVLAECLYSCSLEVEENQAQKSNRRVKHEDQIGGCGEFQE